MRHSVAGRKLGRTSAHRTAMLANLASSLVLHGRIETTLPKAKELRHIADRVVTLGKRGTLAARRRAIALIRDKRAVHKAFAELAGRFADRQGGYTRILKMGWRHGDAAPMAAIEYLPAPRTAAEVAEEKAHAAKKPAAKKAEKKAAPKSEVEATSRKASKAEKPSFFKKSPAAKKAQTRQKKPTGSA